MVTWGFKSPHSYIYSFKTLDRCQKFLILEIYGSSPLVSTMVKKEFEWCNIPWGVYMEENRIIHPSYPNYYYSNKCVTINNDGDLELSMAISPKKIKWLDNNDNIVEYNPIIGCGLVKSLITVGVNSMVTCMLKFPKGTMLWPSFWLTGSECWPPEIDVAEAYSGNRGNYLDKIGIHTKFPFIYRNYRMESNVHYTCNKKHCVTGAVGVKPSIMNNCTDSWNKFVVVWTKGYIHVYVNGIRVRVIKDKKVLNAINQSKMNIILNIFPQNGFDYDTDDGDIKRFSSPFVIRDLKIKTL